MLCALQKIRSLLDGTEEEKRQGIEFRFQCRSGKGGTTARGEVTLVTFGERLNLRLKFCVVLFLQAKAKKVEVYRFSVSPRVPGFPLGPLRTSFAHPTSTVARCSEFLKSFRLFCVFHLVICTLSVEATAQPLSVRRFRDSASSSRRCDMRCIRLNR